MDLMEQLKKILNEDYGIKSEADLIKAMKKQKKLDIGIFCRTEYGGDDDSKESNDDIANDCVGVSA